MKPSLASIALISLMLLVVVLGQAAMKEMDSESMRAITMQEDRYVAAYQSTGTLKTLNGYATGPIREQIQRLPQDRVIFDDAFRIQVDDIRFNHCDGKRFCDDNLDC